MPWVPEGESNTDGSERRAPGSSDENDSNGKADTGAKKTKKKRGSKASLGADSEHGWDIEWFRQVRYP